MTVKELIKELEDYDPNHVVVIGSPTGPGWANIERIRYEYGSTIDLIPEQHPIFSEN